MKKKIAIKVQPKKNKKYIRRKTIAILYHGVDLEKDSVAYEKELSIVDNQTTEIAEYIEKVLSNAGYRTKLVKISPNNLEGLKNVAAHYIFNLVDSKDMEVKIARMLDRMPTPHSGSNMESIITSNNKIKSKSIFDKYKIPTAPYSVVQLKDRITRSIVPSKFPVIIKPAFEHCSVGITSHSIAATFLQLKQIIKREKKLYRQALIVEQYIPGKEFHVTVFEKGQETIALPLAEMSKHKNAKKKWDIYGFKEKWNKESGSFKNVHFISPPESISEPITTAIARDAIRAFYAFGFHDYARFDVRYNPDTKKWYFLEGNANAGIDENPVDAMHVAIKAYGLTLEKFILEIVRNSIGN